MEKIYKNYKDLFENDRELAIELLNEKGKGEWQQEEIYKHLDIESFAEYELLDGWYIDLNFDRDFNGAPNPLDYIDLKQLGNELVNRWDMSANFISSDETILQTSYGW